MEQQGSAGKNPGGTKRKRSSKTEDDGVEKPDRKKSGDAAVKRGGKAEQGEKNHGPPFLPEPNEGLTSGDWGLLFSVVCEVHLNDVDGNLARGGDLSKKGRKGTNTLEETLRAVLLDPRVLDRNIATRYVSPFSGRRARRHAFVWEIY